MHGGTQHVFTGGESVAIDVPDKLSVLLVILPDAHGGAYPQVALMVFDDAAYLLSLQNFGVRESKGLVGLSVEKIESFFRSDNHIAVLTFTDAIRLSVCQNVIPSEVLEAECLRVEAGNAIRSAYPQMTGMVECHAAHPVVAEESLVSSLSHIEHGNLAAFHIIYI